MGTREDRKGEGKARDAARIGRHPSDIHLFFKICLII